MKSKIPIVLIVLLAAAQLAFFSRFTVDDAYISFRYARNLAEGNGLVFNPGERVEGYTNFSFTVLTAPAFWLGVDPLVWARALSLIALAGIFWLAWRWSGLLYGASPRRWVPLLLLALAPPLFYWTMAGLETVLFAFAFLWALYLEVHDRRGWAYPSAHLLLVLTRPEGFLVSGILWAHRFWRRRRMDWRLLLPYAAGVLAYLGFKLVYYGRLLPNTFQAKATGPVIQHQTLYFLGDYPLALLALAAVAFAWRREVLLPALVTAVFLITPELVGGDFMPYYRFYVFLLPLLALLAPLLLERRSRAGRAAVPALMALALAWSWAFYFLRELPALYYNQRLVEVGREAGEWLRARTAPGDWIAVNPAGALPFYSGRPCIDMLGLCDPVIARSRPDPSLPRAVSAPGHAKGDGGYVLSRRPAVILFGNSGGAREPQYLSDHQLARLQEFHGAYALKTTVLGSPDGWRRFDQLGRGRDYFLFEKFQPTAEPGVVWGRFLTLGMDMAVDYTGVVARGSIHFYPSELAFYARRDHPLAALPEEAPIVPPPPIPESSMDAGQLLDAGIFHAASGRVTDAERALRRSLERSDNFYTHFVLGKVYFLAGRSEDGRREMLEALRQRPGMPEALQELAARGLAAP